VKNALPEFAIPWRDVLLHVQDARKRVPPPHERNTDLQSVRPAEFYSAECAPNSSAPCAGEVAADYKPAGRTGQRPVLHRNTDLQSVRQAEFYSAECAPNSSAPRAGEVAAGYKPAGRTGQRPLLHRNTDLQSVRPAEFHSAESAANRQLCL